MGSFIEFNETLQLTKEQGFPTELNLEQHLKNPYKTEDFADKVFEFHNKPNLRVYRIPPVKNIFVENRDGKWIYWGLVYVLETTCDYVNKTTSGKFRIAYINTPEEMKTPHEFIFDRNPKREYFK